MDTNEQALVEVGAAALAAPSAAVAGLVAASIAENTKRTYAAALKRLDAALAGQDLTDASLALYLASVHAAGLSHPVAAMAVAAVKFRFRLQGLASPAGPATDRVLAGLRREGKGRGRGQVDGMRFSEVDTAAAVAANDGGSVAGLRDAALLAVASDGLLRVSEVAALDVGDVQAEADGSGRLFVGASKTDQEGRGAVLYLGAPAVGQRHPPNHPPPRGRHRGPGIRSQSPRWRRAIAGRRRGLDCRDADGGQVAVTGDAGPLCTGPVGSTGRRRSRPLRSRVKPGSTSSLRLPSR